MAIKGTKPAKAEQITEREGRLVKQIIKQNRTRAKKDIDTWRKALQMAENAENPKRVLLLSLYDEILLDMHLTGEMEKRILAATGSNGNLLDAEGKPNKEATDLLTKNWFNELAKNYMISIFTGYRLVQVKELTSEGLIQSIELVNPYNVIPEKGLFVLKAGDEKGIFYKEDPTSMAYTFEIGDPYDLGLLNKCAPHVLFRRFAQSAWSEFSDVFAMPLRVGKTQSKDPASLDRMERALVEMATNSFMIIDKDEEINFIESAKSDGSIFNGLIKLCENEISKGIFSSIIGGTGEGGSYAKEKVGFDIQTLISLADKKNLEGWINEQVLPKLVALGYPFEGLRWEYEKLKDLQALVKIMEGLNGSGYRPKIDWVENEFNMPIEEIPSGAVTTKTDPNKKLSFNFFE